MIDYVALAHNCIMLRFPILKHIITLNSAAYEIIFYLFIFGIEFRPGWGPEQNEGLSFLYSLHV